MPYQKLQMFYKDYYWTARADHDNPKIIGGNDHEKLNRTEGYEMLFFINSLAKTWGWADDVEYFQFIEKIIRNDLPVNIRNHSDIKEWIYQNYIKGK